MRRVMLNIRADRPLEYGKHPCSSGIDKTLDALIARGLLVAGSHKLTPLGVSLMERYPK